MVRIFGVREVGGSGESPGQEGLAGELRQRRRYVGGVAAAMVRRRGSK
jgi:hypothetical protein